jgi:hypothetical protein
MANVNGVLSTLSEKGLATGAFASCFGAIGVSKLKQNEALFPEMRDQEVVAFFAYSLYLNALWTALGNNTYQ